MMRDDRQPYLRIRDLLKKFGSFTALTDISLDVFDGEFVCFLGPSGCGKTTLLRAIAGLDIQTAGSIEQAGKDISALPPSERDFGIVFQSYALFPNLTVQRNIAYDSRPRDTSNEERADGLRLLSATDSLPALPPGLRQSPWHDSILSSTSSPMVPPDPLAPILEGEAVRGQRVPIRDFFRRHSNPQGAQFFGVVGSLHRD